MVTPRAYYNEFDTGAAAWLRELIAEGHLPAGDVDPRSISDVTADDVRGYTQCHFFAGIGGWPYALRLAGWPDDRPVWTGSCPCQPYSSAGRGLGDADPRNLWPVFFRLISECRPDAIFGEQVEAAIRHGWLDTVSADLEGEGYAVGAAVLGAHSVGSPHIRQRLYWVADAQDSGRRPDAGPIRSGTPAGLRSPQRQDERRPCECPRYAGDCRSTCRVADTALGGCSHPWPVGNAGGRTGTCDGGRMGNAVGRRQSQCKKRNNNTAQDPAVGDSCGADTHGSSDGNFWHAAEFVPCRDGKARPVEPGIFPLAHGVSGRVALLRGAGNAIVPQVAAAFVQAWRDVTA